MNNGTVTIKCLLDQRTGTYHNHETCQYELRVFDPETDMCMLLGTISDRLPEKIRKFAEHEMWDWFFKSHLGFEVTTEAERREG